MRLFHLVLRAEWDLVEQAGRYEPASLAREGFVHLSTEEQWPRTAARFFANRTDLLVLVIEGDQTGAEIRFELADGEQFPHLYGPLPLAAVLAVREVRWSSTGEASIE